MKYKAYLPIKLGDKIYQSGEVFALNKTQEENLRKKDITLIPVEEEKTAKKTK